MSDVQTKAKITISRRNKQTGKFENDFSGYVNFFGTLAAKKAARLKERDRIKLGDVDVQTYYSQEKNQTFYNFNVFSFETQTGQNEQASHPQMNEPQPTVDDGEVEDRLPF